jgi:hypothetical protein
MRELVCMDVNLKSNFSFHIFFFLKTFMEVFPMFLPFAFLSVLDVSLKLYLLCEI